MKYKTIICAILKDETPYLEEWIKHHLAIGVEHFVLYDNNSAIPIRETLKTYIRTGDVEVIECPIVESPQLKAYNHCLFEMHNRTKWIAFIDGDEFITLHKHKHISELLKEYEQYAALCLNWRIYTASGHIHKPSGGVKEAYTIPLADDALVNRHVKSIVQPKYVWAVVNPHYASYDLNCKAVNEHYQEVKGPFSLFSNEIAQISHYYSKSFEEWLQKISKGFSASNLFRRKVEDFWDYNPNMLPQREKVEKEFQKEIQEYTNNLKNYIT